MSSSRFAAARPKRAGEEFARTHHFREDDDSGPSEKPRFDVRNPSALAPDAHEEDAVLDADVIGGRGAGTKRNAVNLDGYDSDSENEGFDARAEERSKRKRGDVSLAGQLDEYEGGGKNGANDGDEDEDEDMFGDDNDNEDDKVNDERATKTGKKKAVTFMEEDEIVGQVANSKSGGHISGNFALDPKGKLSTHAMDDRESSDDEEDAILAAQEEDLDEEVGAGGLKRNAPKVDAFNMKSEQEDGRFDDAGNFVRKAQDAAAVHDSWLEGVSKKDMKKAAEAHQKRELEERQRRLEDDALLTADILRTLILQLEKGESALEALARLGKGQKKTRKVPKWKLKKQSKGDNEMNVDAPDPVEDPEQVKIKESIDSITGAADALLARGQTEIYEQEREMLIRQYRRETGEDWVEPQEQNNWSGDKSTKMWEYRWTDGRDGAATQGPYDEPTMVAWQAAGYFGEGVEFRQAGHDGVWSRIVEFS